MGGVGGGHGPRVVEGHGPQVMQEGTRAPEKCSSSVTLLWFMLALSVQVGSPTAFADQEVESKLRDAARTHDRTLFIPSGALWGAYDILKLATSGKLSVS